MPVKQAFHLPQLIRRHPYPPITLPERMAWTCSSLRLWRKCKRKWFWRYILRLRPRYRDKNLMVGSAFHECLGHWYSGRRIPMATIAGQYASALHDEATTNVAYYDQEDYDKLIVMIDNFEGMMSGYEAAYNQDRKDWNIDPKSIEAQFKVDYGKFDFMGKCDLVASNRKGGAPFAVEHKTASRLRDSYVERLPLDTQCRGYVTGITKGLHYKIQEVLYDVVVKTRLRKKANETLEERRDRVADEYLSDPAKYFYREPLRFGKQDVESFEFEMRQTHQEYVELVGRKEWQPEWKAGMGMMDPGLADLYTNHPELRDPTNPWSWQTNDGTCDEYFRTCEYMTLCTVGLDMGTSKMYDQIEDLNEELADDD